MFNPMVGCLPHPLSASFFAHACAPSIHARGVKFSYALGLHHCQPPGRKLTPTVVPPHVQPNGRMPSASFERLILCACMRPLDSRTRSEIQLCAGPASLSTTR